MALMTNYSSNDPKGWARSNMPLPFGIIGFLGSYEIFIL